MGNNTQPRKVTRRQLLALAGASVGALGLAAACSPAAPAATPAPTKAPEAPKPAATTAPAATAAPAATQAPAATAAPAQPAAKTGGVLRFAHTGDAPDLDPHVITLQKYCIIPQLYNTLVAHDANRNPQPELLESWQYSTDRSYVDAKIRKGVKFHSGKDMTSEDIVYTIERIQDPATGGAQLATILKGVKTEAVDTGTVRFKLPGPIPALFDAFDRLYVVQKGATKDDLAMKANGTGPFKLLEWRPNNSARMTRNPNYWKPGKPVVDELQISVIADVASMIINVEAGQIDIAEQIPNQEHERLKKTKDIQLLLSQNPAVTYDILLNVTKPPFTDKRVRQALSYAIDRKRFVERLLYGVGTAKSTPWPTISMAYFKDLDETYQFDLEKAKKLLADAGLASGFETSIITSSQGWPDLGKFAEMYQGDLAKIGVKAKIEDVDSARWNDTLVNSKFPQIITHAFGFAHKDPSLLFTAYPFQPATGVTGYRNDNYSKMIVDASAEPDVEKRKAIYRKITELMLDEQFCVVLTPSFRSWALRSNVKGFKLTLDDMELLEDVSL